MKRRRFPPGITQRGGRWWIGCSYAGRRIRRTVGPIESFTASEVAEVRALEVAKAIREGEALPVRQRRAVTMGELRERYLQTLAPGSSLDTRTRQHFAHLVEGFGADLPVNRLSHVGLIAYRRQREGSPVRSKYRRAKTTAATVTKELAVLRRALNWAAIAGLPIGREGSIFSRLSRADRRSVFPREEVNAPARLSLADVERLCAAMPEPFARVVRFARHTGMRRGEILGLTWERVHEAEAVPHVFLGKTKSGKPRIVPLTREALAAMPRRPLEGGIVFRGASGAGLANLARAWHAARAKAGLPRARFHDLRHSWASDAIEAGLSTPALMAAGGWSQLPTVLRYANPSAESTLAILNRADGALSGTNRAQSPAADAANSSVLGFNRKRQAVS